MTSETRGSSSALEALKTSETPALATDPAARIVFWNEAAERALGRLAHEVLGRRCYEVLGARDPYGNRFCYEDCPVLAMTRRGESVRSFEWLVNTPAGHDKLMAVSIMNVSDSQPERAVLAHVLSSVDQSARSGRSPEKASAPLTQREREVLSSISLGLQNKKIAEELGISLATVRNHVHNILEKLGVHSKLEAVSLAYQQGWVSGRPVLPDLASLP
jgi:DNA-binding CsgD family transcriptional regulator